VHVCGNQSLFSCVNAGTRGQSKKAAAPKSKKAFHCASAFYLISCRIFVEFECEIKISMGAPCVASVAKIYEIKNGLPCVNEELMPLTRFGINFWVII
jgi:hypothetical protein